jgi:hypothetical protein
MPRELKVHPALEIGQLTLDRRTRLLASSSPTRV